jgi:hypothetical protein
MDTVEHFSKGITAVIDGVETDITAEFIQVLRDGIYQDEIAAIRRQRAIQRAGLMERKPNRKLGTNVASMDAVTYWWWQDVAGEGCWSDRSERESILKFAPELRCKQEKLMDRVGANAAFGAGWERLAVDGQPTTREERLVV